MKSKIGPQEAKLIADGFRMIVENREVLGDVLEGLDLTMPNIKTKTMGGAVCWEDIVSASGWRLQRNKLFGNCRIINPTNERVAWGGESAMIRAFNKISQAKNR